MGSVNFACGGGGAPLTLARYAFLLLVALTLSRRDSESGAGSAGGVHAALNAIEMRHIHDAMDVCVKKHPTITQEFIDFLLKHRKFPGSGEPPEEFKCFVKCLGNELKLFNENGDYNVESLREITVMMTGEDVTEDHAHAIISKCTTTVDHEDTCEKAFMFATCKMKELENYSLHKDLCRSC